jgi:hypothetical protein
VVLPLLAIGLVATIGIAVWATPDGVSREQPAASNVGGAPNGAAPARLAEAHADAAGYRASVRAERVGSARTARTSLDVLLTTEGEPASAPTAQALLTGTDGARHIVPLTIVGPGHFTSEPFAIGVGRYQLVTRFDRKGAAVVIRMTIRLT